MKKYGIGTIGCGNISDIYLRYITTKFDNLKLIRIADLDSEKGGGPMYDMGPYYLTVLANLIGPVSTVAGMTSKGFNQRTITSEKIMAKDDSGFKEIPLLFDYSENSRGLGLSKMPASLNHLEEHEANGDLMLHILEVMEKVYESWNSQSFMAIENKF